MLQTEQKNQVKELFKDLKSEYTFDVIVPSAHSKREELFELLNDVHNCSDKLFYREKNGNTLKIELLKNNRKTGICFRGIPNGHEFSSLLLCILNCEGKGTHISDKELCKRIKGLTSRLHFLTYISIECDLCSNVVQSLNAITILNPYITHEIVEGSLYKMEIIEKQIMRLPTVFVNDTLFHVGSGDIDTLVSKIEELCGI